MNAGPVTTRYTEALFNLARREGVLEEVERDVERLAAQVAQPSVEAQLFDARLPAGDRRARVEPLLLGMNRLTRSFVGLLFDKRREDVLRHVGAAFRARALTERNTVEGVVESARPLGPGEIGALSASLAVRLGKRVLLENRTRPALLGGVRVFVESKMLDRSVQGRLDGLRKKMREAPLPSAGA